MNGTFEIFRVIAFVVLWQLTQTRIDTLALKLDSRIPDQLTVLSVPKALQSRQVPYS